MIRTIIRFFFFNLFLAAGLIAAPAYAGVIQAEFSGNISPFWPGPYNGGDAFTISFEWDQLATPDWTISGKSFFDNALQNIVIDVAGTQITGNNARITQGNDQGVYDWVTFRLLASDGDVTFDPLVNGKVFQEMFVRIITPTTGFFSSTADTTTLIDGSIPYSIESIDLYFADQSPDAINMQGGATSSIGPASSVPEPATLILLALGLLGLGSLRHRPA